MRLSKQRLRELEEKFSNQRHKEQIIIRLPREMELNEWVNYIKGEYCNERTNQSSHQ